MARPHTAKHILTIFKDMLVTEGKLLILVVHRAQEALKKLDKIESRDWYFFPSEVIDALWSTGFQVQNFVEFSGKIPARWIMFDYCYHTIQLNPLMREMIKHPGTTRTTIRLKNPLGGRLVALPCSPDKLRGFHPDWVFVDEASIVPSEMITSEIMLMLTKPNFHFVKSRTPKGFDHILRRAFLDREHYSVHHYSSYASPLVSKERLSEWKLGMTREEWTREVEAQWTELANVFFPNGPNNRLCGPRTWRQ